MQAALSTIIDSVECTATVLFFRRITKIQENYITYHIVICRFTVTISPVRVGGASVEHRERRSSVGARPRAARRGEDRQDARARRPRVHVYAAPVSVTTLGSSTARPF